MMMRVFCNIFIVILFVSVVMDIVIEIWMVVVMVCEGGFGILYCNLFIED